MARTRHRTVYRPAASDGSDTCNRRRFFGSTRGSPRSTARPFPSNTWTSLNRCSSSLSNQIRTCSGAVDRVAPTRGSDRSGNAWPVADAAQQITTAARKDSSTGPREQTVCPESVNGVVVGEAGRALEPILTTGEVPISGQRADVLDAETCRFGWFGRHALVSWRSWRQLSCLRNRQTLSETSTTVKIARASALGHSVARPLPLSIALRVIVAK